MCINIGGCALCGQPVYWLIDSQKWHHFSSRNVDCDSLPNVSADVVGSDLLVGVAPETTPTNT